MSLMQKESLEAPELIRAALQKDEDLYRMLGERLRKLNPSGVLTIARGSSDHVANYAAYLIPHCTGRVVASFPPSVSSVLNAKLRLQSHLAICISQSGASPDILGAVERVKAAGALTVGIVNDVSSVLAKAVDTLLPQRAQIEESVAATKTVLLSMLAIARLTAHWSEDQTLLKAIAELPAQMDAAAEASNRIPSDLLKESSDVFVLSRSYGESVAREVALKIKETCGLHSEGFSAAEVRHGPREIVDERYLILAIALAGSDDEEVLRVAKEMKSQGARVLSFGTDPSTVYPIPMGADPRLLPLVALQFLLPWIARASSTLGRNPDRPRYLKSKVVKTN